MNPETEGSGTNAPSGSGAGVDEISLITTGPELSGAVLFNTIFVDIDMRQVSGLDNALHLGPSRVGIDTIFRSHGKIPHNFLHGAGVPEVFIKYMGSLTGQAFQYYSTLISNYHDVCDPYGFPYVYYAIPQLLMISDVSNRSSVLEEISFCLSEMESGKIP